MSGAFSDAYSDAYNNGEGVGMLGIKLNYIPYGHSYHRVCGVLIHSDPGLPGHPDWNPPTIEGRWLWQQVNQQTWQDVFSMTWEQVMLEKIVIGFRTPTTV